MKNVILIISILLSLGVGFLLGNWSIQEKVQNIKNENDEIRYTFLRYQVEKNLLAVLRSDSARSEIIIDSLHQGIKEME